jgi:hypothetical protein
MVATAGKLDSAIQASVVTVFFFQVIRGTNLIESTSSSLSSPASWILGDTGTGGSTRYIQVKALYSPWNPYYNSYYLSYEDSPYSYCSEEDGYVYIYNP